MIKQIPFLSFLLIIFLTHQTFAGNSQWGFIQNAGQWSSKVLFRAEVPSGQLFLEKQQVTWSFIDTRTLNSVHMHEKNGKDIEQINCHAVRMTFNGSNAPSDIIKEDQQETKYNYFIGDDASKWAGGLNAYRGILYKNLYPGIDFHIMHNEKGLKYEMIVKPGAATSQINFSYIGADDVYISEGRLKIKTSIIEFGEEKPIAWQELNGRKIPVDCSFRLTGDEIGFNVGNYRSDLPLVIDPQFIFSTYSGSTADNWGYTATYDEFGNGYSGGIVFGVGFPVTTGAYQVSFNGGDNGPLSGFDIGILKYSPDGTKLLYATYLGGKGNEFPHSIVANSNNELIVFGLTSSTNYPVSSNAYNKNFKGGPSVLLDKYLLCQAGTDIYLSKLSADGSQLLSSTVIGGSKNDGANLAGLLDYNYGDVFRGSVNVDKDNNIIAVSSTSSNDFPITSDAFQKVYGGGLQDGIIVKFSPDLDQLIFSSYFGGTADDGIFGLAIDKKDHFIISGGTNSSNLPVTPNVISQNFNGGIADGFVSIISNKTHQLLYSSYYGTSAYDQSYLVQSDKQGNIFLFGQTEANGNYYIKNAGFYDVSGKQFISKLNPTLSGVIWSTAFGNAKQKPDIVPSAFQVDVCKKVYISGWGGDENINEKNPGTTIGLKVTPDAIRKISDGNDFYIMVLDDQAQNLLYGSFLGMYTDVVADHVDGGTSRFDPRGVIYQSVCAGCRGLDDFPTTPGAWSRTNNSQNCNNALMKFDFEYPITIAAFENTPPPLSCNDVKLKFFNKSINAQTYEWIINGKGVTQQKDFEYTFDMPGKYEVLLIAKNPGACNVNDTTSKIIEIKEPGNLVANITYEKFGVCNGVDVLLNGTGSDQVKWVFGNGNTSTNPNSKITIPYNDTLHATLIVYSGICSDTTKITEILKGLGDYYKQNDANIFTPNDDGVNDCFSPALQLQPSPYDSSYLYCSELQIFNRWGTKVFDSSDTNEPACWNGKNSAGELLPEGVYFYTYLFQGKEFAGIVHLSRN